MKQFAFEIVRGIDRQFYFSLTDGNGSILLVSKSFTTRFDCESGIQAVKTNAPYNIRYQRLEIAEEQFYFNLVDLTGEIVGTSEPYQTEQAMEAGIREVIKIAPAAPINDRV